MTSKDLILQDLASTQVALYEVLENYEHYRSEKNRLEEKKEQLEKLLRQLKKEAQK